MQNALSVIPRVKIEPCTYPNGAIKGFWVYFGNGIVLSVQGGYGNYGSMYNDPIAIQLMLDKSPPQEYLTYILDHCSTWEMAEWHKDYRGQENWVKWDESDSAVLDYQTEQEIVAISQKLARPEAPMILLANEFRFSSLNTLKEHKT